MIEPMSDATLSRIRAELADENAGLHDMWMSDNALHLLAEVDRLRAQNEDPKPAKWGDQHAALAKYLNDNGVAVNWSAGYLHLTGGCDGRYLETDLSDNWKVVQWHE